jgi:competence protein ComEC
MKDFPIVKVAVIFVAGILSGKFISISLVFIGIFFIATLLIILIYKKSKDNFSISALSLISTGALIFSIANYSAKINEITFPSFLTDIDKVNNTTITGTISKIDLMRSDALTAYISTDSMYSSEFSIKEEFEVLCKIKLSKKKLLEFYEELKPGYKISVTGFYYKGKDRRNPGEFDYDAYLKSKGIVGILGVTENSSIKILDTNPQLIVNVIHQTRKAIDFQIKKYHSPETAALLRGLLLADRGEIDYETKDQFINAGVVHVLAVSGLHVGYIIMILIFVFGRFNLFIRSIVTIFGLLCFMFLTGIPASVFRATVMAIAIILAVLTNRSTNLINSISIAAIIVLIFNPNEINNPGFQLSFAAVLAIGIVYPYFNEIIIQWNIQNKILKYTLLFIAVSLSAQIGTLPFTLLYFNKFSTIALLTNFIVIPGIGFIIATAIITLFFSAFIPFVAVYLAASNELITSAILYLIKFSGSLNFSFINVRDYSLFDLVIFYLMFGVLLFYLTKFKRHVTKSILIILCGINIFLLSSFDNVELLPENSLSLMMIDVGQGDSFLIKFPNGKTALIDAGNTTAAFDNGERVILPLLNYLGIEKIDYGMVSHMDADHYGGFVSLVLTYKIKEIYKPRIDSSLTKDIKLEKFLNENRIKINYYEQGRMEIGNSMLYYLNDETISEAAGESTNDKSEMIKLVYGNTSFLFTGDMSKKIEKLLVSKYRTFLDSDVLKIAHHGSKTSSSDELLKYVSPEYCLISAGFKNKFGHPANEILEKISSYNSLILRTDMSGAIILTTDGESVNLNKWNNSL